MNKLNLQRITTAFLALLMILSILVLPTKTALAEDTAPQTTDSAAPQVTDDSVPQLKALSVQYKGAELVSGFSPDTYTYTINAAYSVDSVDIGAEPRTEGDTVSGTGNGVALAAGDNVIIVTVFHDPGDGSDPVSQAYTITITRAAAPSPDCSLSSLTVTADGADLLAGKFSPDMTEYDLTTSAQTADIEAAAEGASVSGDMGVKTLTAGENGFKVTVTAQDGSATKEYIIRITYTVSGQGEVTPMDESDFTYELDGDNNATITGYNGGGGNIVIPATIDGYPVVAIGDDVFEYNGAITSLTFPSSIETMGEFVADRCDKLTTIVFSSGLNSIGRYCFANCKSLTSISLPASLSEIDGAAFSSDKKLTAITVNSGNANFISVSNVLFSYDKTKLLVYPAGKTGASYTIPAGVTFIAESAFAGNSLIKTIYFADSSCTDIDSGAFDGCTALSNITLPEGVQELHAHTFEDCSSLTSIYLPDSLTTIEEYAFWSSGLTSITIPENVDDLHGDAFWYCESLTSVNVASGNTHFSVDSDGVLYNQDKTTLVYYPTGKTATSYTVKSGVTEIGDSAFFDSNITSVTLPDTLTDIGDHSFQESRLESVDIPGSVESIGMIAFADSGLTEVTIESGVEDIFWGAFSDCSLTSVEVPASVTSMDESFDDCGDMTEAVFLGNCPPDDEDDFNNCSDDLVIYYVTGNTGFPDTWNGYPTQAFDPAEKHTVTYDGNGASSGAVPSDTGTYKYGDPVTVMENTGNLDRILYVFAGWDTKADGTGISYSGGDTFKMDMKNVSLYAQWEKSEAGKIYAYGDYKYEDMGTYVIITAFTGKDADLSIPAEINGKPVKGIGENAFYNNDCIKNVTMPSGVTVIGDEAFEYCYALTSVTFPDTLRSIGEGSFFNCLSLGSVSLPAGVTSIGSDAFAYCDSITSFNIPDDLTSAGDGFLIGSRSLESITIGSNSHFALQDGVLFTADMTELILYPAGKDGTSYTVPDGVTVIDEGAFCASALESVTVSEGVKEISYNTFTDCGNLSEVNLPDSLETIDFWAFAYCENLESINLPKNVGSIDGSAFYDCTSLTSITVDSGNPNYISDGGVLYSYDGSTLVAYPCALGTSFTIPDSVEIIGSEAFNSCQLEDVTIGSGVNEIDWDAFDDCSFLKSVVIPDNVEYIYDDAFFGCGSLSSATIGTGIEYMSPYAFMYCSNLAAVYFLADSPNMSEISGEIKTKELKMQKTEDNIIQHAPLKFKERKDMGKTMSSSDRTFYGSNPSLIIYYTSGASGFGKKWHGYPTQVFSPSVKCNVSFSLNGVSGDAPDAQSVYKNGKAVVPFDAYSDDNMFYGWYKDSACKTKWDFEENKITKATTIYARWIPRVNAYLNYLEVSVPVSDDTYFYRNMNTGFSPMTYNYKASLAEYEGAFRISAEAWGDGAEVTIDGEKVNKKDFDVDNGASKKVTIVVTAGTTTKTYTVTVTRDKSSDNYLKNIAAADPDSKTIPFTAENDPATTVEFDKYASVYYLRLGENTKSVTITPDNPDFSKLYIDGKLKTSKTYPVNNGGKATCTIKVVSQTGKPRTYTVYITRDKSTDAYLKSITTNSSKYPVSPAFTDITKLDGYTVTLPDNVSSVTLYAKPEGYGATTKITNLSTKASSTKGSLKVSLANGKYADIKITVTAQASTSVKLITKDYTLRVYRAAAISSFSASPKVGSYPALSPGGDNMLTFKWKQSNAGKVTVEVSDGTNWNTVYTDSDVQNAGTYTYPWDGKVSGDYLAPGKYQARVSVSYTDPDNGKIITSSYTTLSFKILGS